MDIPQEIHDIIGSFTCIYFGLEPDSCEGDRLLSRMSADKLVERLKAVNSYLSTQIRCQTKGCPHYGLGQENGCTIYEHIAICVDSKKGA